MPDPWSDDWSATKKAACEKPLSGAILSSVQPQGAQPPGFRGQFTLKTRDKTLKPATPPGRAPPRPAVVLENKETYEEKQRRYQEVREKLLGKD
ncbi:hypothetical protein CJU89_4601 [Yarrowia sp. B02]|nr:hypothetical protein CJU89_4601 [Yarrowia sp. B02]